MRKTEFNIDAFDNFIDVSYDLFNLIKRVDKTTQSDKWVADATEVCNDFSVAFAKIYKTEVIDI